jgi:hypothetical protein
MKEEMLAWMNERYPAGFCCLEVDDFIPLETISALTTTEVPILIHISSGRLQELVTSLIESGTSPAAVCFLPEHEHSVSLGNVVLKSRELKCSNLFLVIQG